MNAQNRGIRHGWVALGTLLLVGCALPPRPQFKPVTIDDDEAVRAWLDAGETVGSVHSFVDDQVDIIIAISSRDANFIQCAVTVENWSQHDVVLDFASTTIEDSSGTIWRLAGMVYAVEQDAWGLEWRTAPGETNSFDARFHVEERAVALPTSFAVRLEGYIGPMALSDTFEFNRIKWP